MIKIIPNECIYFFLNFNIYSNNRIFTMFCGWFLHLTQSLFNSHNTKNRIAKRFWRDKQRLGARIAPRRSRYDWSVLAVASAICVCASFKPTPSGSVRLDARFWLRASEYGNTYYVRCKNWYNHFSFSLKCTILRCNDATLPPQGTNGVPHKRVLNGQLSCLHSLDSWYSLPSWCGDWQVWGDDCLMGIYNAQLRQWSGVKW